MSQAMDFYTETAKFFVRMIKSPWTIGDEIYGEIHEEPAARRLAYSVFITASISLLIMLSIIVGVLAEADAVFRVVSPILLVAFGLSGWTLNRCARRWNQLRPPDV